MAGNLEEQREFISIVGGVFQLGKTYTTSLNLVFEVDRWKDGVERVGFLSLVGPAPGTEDPVSFTIKDEVSMLPPGGTNLQLQLTGGCGFAYMAGVQPYGGTDGGSSTSEGTIMLVQRADQPGGVYHRFFRLESDQSVQVKDASGAQKDIMDDHWYVQIDPAGEITDPEQIPTGNSEIRSFVEQVIDLAEKAGLPTPEADLP